MASTRSARNTRRNRSTDEEEDLQVDERALVNEDYTTPSASFIETTNHTQDPTTTEQTTELGWKMYSLEEKKKREDEITCGLPQDPLRGRHHPEGIKHPSTVNNRVKTTKYSKTNGRLP